MESYGSGRMGKSSCYRKSRYRIPKRQEKCRR
nr:MAG TPA: hypothetical protein [Caudoviricetes sp.]